jgi:hypothetical protein
MPNENSKTRKGLTSYLGFCTFIEHFNANHKMDGDEAHGASRPRPVNELAMRPFLSGKKLIEAA